MNILGKNGKKGKLARKNIQTFLWVRKLNKTNTVSCNNLFLVSENSFKQQKATIQKLTSKDVKLLVNSSLNLNELYKLKDNKFIEEHSYSDISVIESVASLKTDLLPDEQLPEESRDFEVVPEIELNRYLLK